MKYYVISYENGETRYGEFADYIEQNEDDLTERLNG